MNESIVRLIGILKRQDKRIVVANGCTDHTQAYMEGMGAPFKLIWSAEPLGYTKATNLGIQAAKGEFVVLLNNDTQLLAQENNRWLDWLAGSANLRNAKMGRWY